MLVKIRQYSKNEINRNKKWVLVDKVLIDNDVIIAIDGSTSNTGVSIISLNGSLLYTIALSKEEADAVEYKIKYKKFMSDIITSNKNFIKHIWYEEHFIGYAEAAKALFMLRSSIKEIIIENELSIQYSEVSNKRWKKYLFKMCGQQYHSRNTDEEKAEIKKCISSEIPSVSECVTQDEIDSIGIGMVAIVYGNVEQLESEGKPSKFKYEAKFFSASDDDEFMMQYGDGTGIIPKSLIGKGCIYYELNGREKFDNAIYKKLNGIDLPLILVFPSNKYGNIILENRIAELADESDYIYAVIYRKTRKK